MSEEVVAREIPGPGTWHWKISLEDVEKIKKVDRETIDRVYFDNYDKFKRICRNRFSILWEDALQEIYLLIPYLDYTNAKTFFRSILSLLYRRICGRSVFTLSALSLDKTLSIDEQHSFIDFLAIECDFLHEDEEQNIKVIGLIDNQRFLSDEQKDYLLSVAFNCQNIKGLFNYAKNGLCVS